MNKIFVRNSCKVYESISASRDARDAKGNTSGGTANGRKDSSSKEEEFREILRKKLRAA